MADKNLIRIEAKLDALLDKLNVEYKEPTATPVAPRPLTPAEQQAIDNAPATPIGANGPATDAPRVTTLNAPVTPAATEPVAKGKK